MSGEIIFDGIIAILAAIGMATLVWMQLDWLIESKAKPGLYACFIIAANGISGTLEDTLDTLLWRNDVLSNDRELIIVDYGMSQADYELSEIFKQKYEKIIVLQPDELIEYIELHLPENSSVTEILNEKGSYKN